LLWLAPKPVAPVKDSTLGWNTPQNLSTPEGAAAAVQILNKYVETLHASAAQKEEMAETLAGHLGLDYNQIRGTQVINLMTPEQAARIHAGGISIELHTHRHRTPRNPELFAREIRDNREKIQAITGESPRHFCYPSGVWRQDLFSTLKENGIETATTCDPGLALRDTPPLLLPRFVDTTTQTDVEFEGWISGVNQFLPRKSYSPEV
ncbi:MAG TPA: polysaccharide deacetylase family protein, partial [Bryobacteraceae bacterium]|nr:polysaccharide deacetylase family protein [Bryobacteraceae bacterium]